MKTRLFHTIVICGAALAAPLACIPAEDAVEVDASVVGAPDPVEQDRCRLPDGTCNEHCAPLPGGECLDPCFVHTTECSPDCLQPDGSCGWPPTK